MIVIVDPPSFGHILRLSQARKQVFIQAFITDPGVEGFDETVLAGLPRLYEPEINATVLRPFEHRHRGVSGAIVTDDDLRFAIQVEEPGQFPGHPKTVNRKIHGHGVALSGEIIDNIEPPDTPAAG